MGRLRPGSRACRRFRATSTAAAAAMAHDWPDTHRQRGARFRLFREGNSELRGLKTAAAL